VSGRQSRAGVSRALIPSSGSLGPLAITRRGVAGTGVGVLVLLLVVQLLLVLLRLGYEDDRGEAVLGLDAGVRLQAAVLGGVRPRLPRVPPGFVPLAAIRAGRALLLVLAAVAQVAHGALHAAAVRHGSRGRG